MEAQHPPEALWEDGPNTAVLEVRVHQDEENRIWSVHQFRSPSDEQKAFHWPGGGARQLAYAFLTEALRREAYTSILVEMSKDKDFLKKYKASNEEIQAQAVAQLSQAIQTILSNSALKMGDGIAKEILEMLSKQV